MKKSLIQHIALFCVSLILCTGFLLLGACLPQPPIDANIRASAERMAQEGNYPTIADHAFASTLDYATDALILQESKATTISQWDTIFTNPLFKYESDDGGPVYNLYQYSIDENPQPADYYVQYWMGFRPVVRLMLTYLDYYQILRVTALCFFVLFAAVMCSVAKEAGSKTAFLFALSIIAVRPYVVAVSLQFSCCFIIAFLAMLLIPRLHQNPRWESLFFLELGILTMYFDFYTTPILTFGMPMIYLYILKNRDHQQNSAKRIGINAVSWSAGYLFMWLAKLVLTSALTSADGIGAGLSSFAGRIGIEQVESLKAYYNPIMALRTVAVSLYSDQQGKLLFVGTVALAVLLLLARFLKEKHSFKEILQHSGLIILAMLPIIWFMAAAQPTANHHWFQYRGIAVSFWAGFVCLEYLFRRKSA